jgi:hypothetical protein
VIVANTILQFEEGLPLFMQVPNPFSGCKSRLFGSLLEPARRHPPVLPPDVAILRPNRRLLSSGCFSSLAILCGFVFILVGLGFELRALIKWSSLAYF